MTVRLAISILILLGMAIPANGKVLQEDEIDLMTREIAKTLRCAVCQTESVWESNAELARQMRDIIRERVAKGESAEEIKAYFLSRYGDYILLEPRKQGLNWLIWVGPFVLLGTGGLVLLLVIRRWTAMSVRQDPGEIPALDENQRRRIEKEIQSRDQ